MESSSSAFLVQAFLIINRDGYLLRSVGELMQDFHHITLKAINYATVIQKLFKDQFFKLFKDQFFNFLKNLFFFISAKGFCNKIRPMCWCVEDNNGIY